MKRDESNPVCDTWLGIAVVLHRLITWLFSKNTNKVTSYCSPRVIYGVPFVSAEYDLHIANFTPHTIFLYDIPCYKKFPYGDHVKNAYTRVCTAGATTFMGQSSWIWHDHKQPYGTTCIPITNVIFYPYIHGDININARIKGNWMYTLPTIFFKA